jgi:hypothetical protein
MMCCDLCDLYLDCEEVDVKGTKCCTRCPELNDCAGEKAAGKDELDDDYSSLDDDEDVDDEDFDEDEDYDEDDDDEDAEDEDYDEDLRVS